MSLNNRRDLPETIGIYCLYILVGALPLVFVYQTNDIFELAKLTVLRVTTFTMIGAWAVMCFRERRFIIARTPIDYFILAYLVVYSLATVFSGNPLTSLLGEYGRFDGLLTIYNYAAVFFLAGIFIRENALVTDTGEFVRGLMFTAIGTACLVSIYGIVQRFGFDFLAWSSSGVDTTRAFSTMGNPIYIAAYLTIMISVAVALFVSESGRLLRRNDGTIRILVLLGAAVTVMFATLVLTFSRAGWGGMIIAFAVLAVLMLIDRKSAGRAPEAKRHSALRSGLLPYLVLGLAVAVVVGGVVGLSTSKASGPTKSAINRMLSVFDFAGPAYADRASMWKSSIAMIKDRPVLGYGPDMFGTYYPRYRRLDIVTFEREVNKIARPRYQNRPHMDILQQGVSAGVLGMLVYAAMWIAFLWFAVRGLRRGSAQPGDGTLLSAGVLAGLVGYIFQIQFSFSTVAVTPLVWIFMAVIFSLAADREPRAATQDTMREPNASRLTSKLSLLAVSIALIVLAVLAMRPLIADYYFDQALVAMAQGNAFGAQGNFDLAISFNPYEPAYSDYAGSSYVEEAKTATEETAAFEALLAAIRYEKLAIALNPHVPGYRFNLANAEYYYSFLGGLSEKESAANMKDALTQFKFAAANDPMQPDFHFNLASAYIRFDKKAQAIEEIKAGLKIDPTRLDAKAWLATLEKGAGL